MQPNRGRTRRASPVCSPIAAHKPCPFRSTLVATPNASWRQAHRFFRSGPPIRGRPHFSLFLPLFPPIPCARGERLKPSSGRDAARGGLTAGNCALVGPASAAHPELKPRQRALRGSGWAACRGTPFCPAMPAKRKSCRRRQLRNRERKAVCAAPNHPGQDRLPVWGLLVSEIKLAVAGIWIFGLAAIRSATSEPRSPAICAQHGPSAGFLVIERASNRPSAPGGVQFRRRATAKAAAPAAN